MLAMRGVYCALPTQTVANISGYHSTVAEDSGPRCSDAVSLGWRGSEISQDFVAFQVQEPV